MHHRLSQLVAAAVLLPALTGFACTVNPATGQRQLTLMSEQQELAMGQQAHEQVLASMPLYDDEAVQRYVAGLGQRLAAASERPNLPWTFVVVDDPAVNAFAIPGGHVYITRGILTHLNSEAELASVMGHEIGHVTGRHSVERMSKQQLLSIGLGVGSLVSPEFAQFGDLAQIGAGLLVLRFSRQDELEADRLGLRYMVHDGYDPQEMPKVFATLGRVSEAASQGQRLPNWLATHPNPDDRFSRIGGEIGGLSEYGDTVRRTEYLDQVRGMVFGADPRQGYFVSTTFYHPELKFQLQFPQGWVTANQTQAVVGMSPDKDGAVQLTLVKGSAREAARAFAGQQGIQTDGARAVTVSRGLDGFGVPFTATTQQSQELAGMAVFLEYGGRTYQLLGLAPRSAWSAQRRAIETAVGSFAALTERRYLDVSPARVELVNLPAPMPVAEFARRHPSTVSNDELAILNGVDPGGTLPAGPAKRVVGGQLPQ